MEQFFIAKPILDGEIEQDGNLYAAYKTASGERLKWSGGQSLPAIGETVKVTLNSIGPAVIKGYFSSHGFLGVMTKAKNPPKWLRDQIKRGQATAKFDWQRDGIGCEFGVEIETV